ncbi:hypothetical protein [Desulforhabdus sp. TSK]|uniref:hypothetical protein n=1 Tax=Desulforhabdus sp. TSK TaxID=2925014 RepID=UPI001FC83507|nr:hypothetical protein [Desulforhabdus sp. TSK]GKT10455.1 hypothetical protein DSTSK_37600 [Desulforhabdus sp. TSK]
MIPIEASGPKVVKNAHLVVFDTLRQTFYSIWIKEHCGKYRVRKASAARGRVWDERTWEFVSLDEAERFFNRRIREKTDPKRRSPRKYTLKHLLSKEGA